MWQPAVLQPDPDPAFIRELTRIDAALRVVWGFNRYLKNCWVIERKMSPERYFTSYASLFDEGHPRYVDQPIFDHDQPLYDDDGNLAGYKVVGYRRYDLAPEYEWVRNIEHPDGSFKPLGNDDLLAIRREYAWNRNHPLSRHRFEAEQRARDEARKKDFDRQLSDTIMEACHEAWHDHDLIVTTGMPATQLAGTEL